MARGDHMADPYRLFVEEHGMDSYTSLVKEYPQLRDRTVEFIARRAVHVAFAKVNPLEVHELDREEVARTLMAVITEQTLGSQGNG